MKFFVGIRFEFLNNDEVKKTAYFIERVNKSGDNQNLSADFFANKYRVSHLIFCKSKCLYYHQISAQNGNKQL